MVTTISPLAARAAALRISGHRAAVFAHDLGAAGQGDLLGAVGAAVSATTISISPGSVAAAARMESRQPGRNFSSLRAG